MGRVGEAVVLLAEESGATKGALSKEFGLISAQQ